MDDRGAVAPSSYGDKYRQDERYQKLRACIAEAGLQGHSRFYDILCEMAVTHADKNHDYAGDRDPLANLRECEAYGITAVDGVVTRLTDKDSRFKNWLAGWRSKGKGELRVKDESIGDTLNDRSVYTILLRILIEESLDRWSNKGATHADG